MIKKYIFSKLTKISVTVLFLVFSVIPAKAAVTYGSGYYTNLCDSGTSANYYNCNSGCDPELGLCQGKDNGVVKWICQGKWNQCLESESQWSDNEKLDNVSCGYTVQLSLFDKKCRRIDGSWDDSCKLLGYMTWYSGDCYDGQSDAVVISGTSVSSIQTETPTLTPKTVITPTSTIVLEKSTPTPKPLPTTTIAPVPGMCGVSCKLAGDCKLGFACVGGECRNPACPEDGECFCKGIEEATMAAVLQQTPETGVETWLGMLIMFGFGMAGFRLKLAAKKIW